jgi:drug/metabolite transporter (DMT)-like permease
MRQDSRLRPVLTLCLGVLVFSTQDLVVKLLAGSYPVHEVVCIRCLAGFPVLLVLVQHSGGLRGILSPRAGWLAVRGAMMLLAYTGYYLAFPVMRLADILALNSIVPLVVAALARITLGERISPRGWTAVAIGFLGALAMVQPGIGVFEPASLLPMVGAAAYASAQLLARRLAATETAAVMAFHQNVVFLLGAGLFALATSGAGVPEGRSLAFLLRPWTLPSVRDLLLLALCGPVSALGMTLLGQAYRIAPQANVVAAFEYTALIWATLYGYVFWGEVPGAASFFGAALIVGGGLMLLASPVPPPRPQAVGG